ncbi:protein EVI2B isoform X2 [Rhineura floridana]|nr:protein EVI2B isoform X2 [Rhineura floridana]
MDAKCIVPVFFYGQLWWNLLSAEIKGPGNSPPPALITTTVVAGPGKNPPTYSYQTIKPGVFDKYERQTSSSQNAQVPVAEDPKPHNGHLIVAVVIGVILIVMIATIVGIFLWRRWKKSASSVPHWAGRSPFADGDVLDVTADKEPGQGTKRTSVLSLLPWRFNKETQLLENVEGELPESKESLDVLPKCAAEERETESSHTLTVYSASMQAPVSEGPSSLINIPLQPDGTEPLDLPPPPNWLGGVNGDLCPKQTESLSLEPNAEIQHSGSLDLSHQIPGEGLLLPPPPEDFLSN